MSTSPVQPTVAPLMNGQWLTTQLACDEIIVRASFDAASTSDPLSMVAVLGSREGSRFTGFIASYSHDSQAVTINDLPGTLDRDRWSNYLNGVLSGWPRPWLRRQLTVCIRDEHQIPMTDPAVSSAAANFRSQLTKSIPDTSERPGYQLLLRRLAALQQGYE